MIIVINAEDGDMKTGTSISIVAAVMFTIPMLSAPAQGGRQ
jgi:hypothetical protein